MSIVDTLDRLEPVCPFCYKYYKGAKELGLKNDDELKIECPHCGENYIIECSCEITYSTYEPEDDDEEVKR